MPGVHISNQFHFSCGCLIKIENEVIPNLFINYKCKLNHKHIEYFHELELFSGVSKKNFEIPEWFECVRKSSVLQQFMLRTIFE